VEQGEDISMLEAGVLEYRPNETAGLVADPDLQRDARKVSIRALAKKAGVSERTVKAIRNGKRLRRTTTEKLRTALRALANRQ
jgi:Helix-turn-helix